MGKNRDIKDKHGSIIKVKIEAEIFRLWWKWTRQNGTLMNIQRSLITELCKTKFLLFICRDEESSLFFVNFEKYPEVPLIGSLSFICKVEVLYRKIGWTSWKDWQRKLWFFDCVRFIPFLLHKCSCHEIAELCERDQVLPWMLCLLPKSQLSLSYS